MRHGWIGVTLTLLGACAHHVTPPKHPAGLQATASASEPVVLLRHCLVQGESAVDDRWDVRRLCDVLAATWEDQAALVVRDTSAATPTELASRPTVDVVFTVERTHMLTGLAEVFSVLFLGLMPFVPAWDFFTVAMHVELRGPDGVLLDRYDAQTNGRAWALFYAPLRTGYVEDALREAYADLFAASGAALLVGLDLRPGSTSGPASPHPLIVRAQRSELVAARLTSDELEDALDPVVIVRERRRARGGWQGALLDSLGGLEASAIFGLARVSSRATNDFGVTSEIASGEAVQQGYKLSNYAAPRTTGLFVLPSLGYLDQKITIEDFRADLPVVDAPGREIGANCSDPVTGQPLDCAAPNVYELRLRSGFLGARAGANLVLGDSDTEGFFSADLAGNLVELRDTEAKLSSYRARGTSWAFARSASVGASTGVRWPLAHLGLRLAFEAQLYRDFDYAEPLEFKGFVQWNPDKDVYERPRTFVDGADLRTWSLTLAFAGVF